VPDSSEDGRRRGTPIRGQISRPVSGVHRVFPSATDHWALIVVDEAYHLREKLLDELRIIRDRAGCGLALVADETIHMALARCQQVDGRIGLKIDLATQPSADVEDIAAGVLGRRPSMAELKTRPPSAKAPAAFTRCAGCWVAPGWWRKPRVATPSRPATSPLPPMRAWLTTRARRPGEPADSRPGLGTPSRGTAGVHRRQLSPRLGGQYLTPSRYISLCLGSSRS